MNPIEALNFSFQSKVGATTKPSSQKANGTSAKETGNFAEMIASLSKESKITNEKPTSETPQGELLEKLEEVLTALQEIPNESLTPEEQDIMYAIVEMLTVQLNQMEKLQISEPVFGNPVTISPPPANLSVNSVPVEKLTMDAPAQEKLMAILKQIDQLLKEMSAVTTKPFEEAPKLLGVEGKTLPADPKKIEQLFQQLATMLKQIETEQQASGKHITLPQMEQIEQQSAKQVPIQQVEQLEQNKQMLKQLTGMTQSMDSQSQQEPQTQSNNAQQIDASKQAPSTQATQVTQATTQPETVGLETVQTEQNNQPVTTTGSESVKASPTAVRPEAPAPTPTVRMSNLIEELSDVMKGSFSLNGNKEGTQIKVSIFPEHLGHLDIRLTELNGKIAAQIFTSSMVTKEALDMQINQLRNALMQQGVTVDRIEVTHQDTQQSFGQQNANPDQRFTQQQQKQGTASRDKNGYLRIEEEAAIERKQSVEGMMKVDYTI